MSTYNALEDQSLHALDWAYIHDSLKERVGSAPARERLDALTFSTDRGEIQHRLDETSEFRKLLDAEENIPIGGIRDLRPLLEAAGKGDILVGRELLDIGNTLEAAHTLKRYVLARSETCPRTSAVAGRIPDLQELARMLLQSFDGDGELSMSAWPALAGLRRRIHQLHNRIRDKLTHLLGGDALGALAQDQFVTMRNDRYVVPLKAQAKGLDVGIVHDASGSGQTVFVEPNQVIPMNNELKMAEAEYRREERRILTELTSRVSAVRGPILHSLETVVGLEIIHARAELSRAMQAHPPVLAETGRIALKQARHPVLVLRGKHVVPNDLEIGGRFQALILSGPNTGGKTVALKTLGLCALMTRAGLHIPALPGSEMGIFSHILSDIGDSQDLEDDLSTFSGHILGVTRILDAIGRDASRALVLLDEIAVGTDPVQGAALARAILETFVARGARVVVTTHYAELKTLSVQDPRFTNGRVEYDAERLEPTYRVVIGTPGRSHALNIAEKLGVDPRLIARARSYLDKGERALEELLGELETALRGARDEKRRFEQARREAESLKARYEAQVAAIHADADRLRRQAMADFEAELKAARAKLSKIVRDAQRKDGVRIITPAQARERIRILADEIHALAPRPLETAGDLQAVDPNALTVGAEVFVAGLGKTGRLATRPDGEGRAEVQLGDLRLKVKVGDLRRPPPPGLQGRDRQAPGNRLEAQAAKRRSRQASQPRTRDASDGRQPLKASGDRGLDHVFQTSRNAFDMRGMRVDEGIEKLERFLDRASLDGEPYVFIIHGHGTGALKRAVRTFLKESSYVSAFKPAPRNQGGDGATVAALR